MQGHYLTHFAAMLQIKLNVFSCTFYRTFTTGVKGRKHADRAFIRGWGWGWGLIIGCIFYLQVNLFITGAYGEGGGGAYKRRFTALQECFSFSLLFYSIPKS